MTTTGTADRVRRVAGGYDLHTHSDRSDGTLPPAAVVALAAEARLDGLALTDHDTTDGWDEAASACDTHGLDFVPGIELSAESGGFSVHLLGYWVDREHPPLWAECARLRGERDRRAVVVLERLAVLGVAVSAEHVRAIASGAPVGRPHIAAAMVETGAAADLDDAFERYLRDGGPAYEPKRALSPADAVRLISAAGGSSVLAHPACTALPDGVLDELVVSGLAGIESDHPSHDPESVARWRHEARRRGLVATGSSDFHGSAKPVKIGERTTAAVALQELHAARGASPAAPSSGQRGRTSSW